MFSNHAQLAFWRSGLELCTMASETQAVMTMRMLGMAGLWSVDDQENTRMVFEKPEVFGRAIVAGTLAAATGHRLDHVLRASTQPIRAKTKANAKRLASRGARRH